jgi:O-antigen ligase
MYLTLTVLLTLLIMLGLSWTPLGFGMFYLFSRPLFQATALEHNVIFGKVPMTAAFALTVILYVFTVSMVRKDFTIFPKNSVPLYLLIWFSSMSFYNSLDLVNSLGYLLKLLTAAAFYLLIYNAIKTRQDALRLFRAVMLGSVVPIVIGFVQYATGNGCFVIGEGRNRMTGTLGLPNAFGIFVALSICATVTLLLIEKRRSARGLIVLVLLGQIVATILSLNRGTWIALTLAVLIATAFHFKRVKVRWFVVCGVLISIAFSGLIISRFKHLEATESWQRTNTLQGRIEMWQAVSELIPSHPWIGYGVGTAKQVMIKFKKMDNVPHNDYVRLVLETGFLGCLIYIYFLLRELLFNLRTTAKIENWGVNYPALICIIYWIVISAAQNNIYHVVNFPLFLALMAAAKKWNEIPAES